MRDAISMLEKCSKYSTNLSIENVLQVTGNLSYTTFLKLTNGLVDKDEQVVIESVEGIYSSGVDMRLFIEQYLDFILDLTKYCVFKDISSTKIPTHLEEIKLNGNISPLCVKYATGFEGNLTFYNNLVDKLLDLKNKLRYDTFPRTTVLATMVGIVK